MILEVTRGYDWRPDWHRDTDRYKTELYLRLRDKLLRCLGDRWSVEIVTFTLGVRGSYEAGSWTSHLAKFGLTGIKAAALMEELVTSCLVCSGPGPLAAAPRLEHQARAADSPKSGNWSIATPMGASCH